MATNGIPNNVAEQVLRPLTSALIWQDPVHYAKLTLMQIGYQLSQ